MSDKGPIWKIYEPIQSYPDGRFDDPAIPDASTPVWASDMGMTPPLAPQQPTPEDMERELYILRSDIARWKLRYFAAHKVAAAARLAVPDIETVFRLYGHIQTHPLPELRALLDMLTPFAPKWETMIEDMDAARQFVAEWQATEGEDE